MSAPTHRPSDNGLLLYAPKWARDADIARQSDRAAPLSPDEEPRAEEISRPPAAIDPDRFEGDVAIQQLRTRRSLDPDFFPAPPIRLRARSSFAMFGRFILAVLFATGVALIAVGRFPLPDMSKAINGKITELASLTSRPAEPASIRRPEQNGPRLVVEGGRGTMGEAIPIGVTIQGAGDGVVALISGLLAGTQLSKGSQFGVNGWHVPATDLASTLVLPPHGFVGTMDLAVDLRLADNRSADRRSVRLDWTSTTSEATAPRQLDPEEIATLRKRGEEFLATGDIAAARLMFLRAAEARDAHAAFALAATYDPLVLGKLEVYGFVPDLAMARAWYEKAREFGSLEARQRLELLASQVR